MASNHGRNAKWIELAMMGSLVLPGIALANGQDSAKGQPGQAGVAATGQQSNEIRNVQEKLNAKGYDTGTPDGVFGKKTASAIRDFQRDNNEHVTGRADSNTLAALGVQAGGMAGNEQQAGTAGNANPSSSNTSNDMGAKPQGGNG